MATLGKNRQLIECRIFVFLADVMGSGVSETWFLPFCFNRRRSALRFLTADCAGCQEDGVCRVLLTLFLFFVVD